MAKKRVVIISTSLEGEAKARKYAEDLGYETFMFDKNNLPSYMAQSSLDRPFHIGPFVVGLTLTMMASADAVCFAPDWQDSDYCKDIHLIAFKYGIEIIFAPEE